MANPGNTGNRYKMQKVEAVFARGSVVIVRMACGHEKPPVSPYPSNTSAEQYAAERQEWIGHKWRCNDCKAAQ